MIVYCNKGTQIPIGLTKTFAPCDFPIMIIADGEDLNGIHAPVLPTAFSCEELCAAAHTRVFGFPTAVRVDRDAAPLAHVRSAARMYGGAHERATRQSCNTSRLSATW